jgi:alpha-tubulin suppressor-like RCC1 family protein
VRLAVAIAVAALGCGQHAAYVCTTDAQCVLAGNHGTCEPDGHCAFPDPTCPDGNRYEPNAGDGFGGQCVGEVDGGQTCGSVGGACCAGETPCGDNAFCASGTCKQCVVDVTLGIFHSCFLKYDGTVWCSGRNDDGALGNAAQSSLPISTPVQVRDSTNAVVSDATALGAGQILSCAIRANGALWCWGENGACADGGQVGDGTTNDRTTATRVLREDGTPFTNVAQVESDICRTCARDTAGGVWCWGSKESGAIGDGGVASHAKAVPVTAMGGGPISDAADLSLNGGHACYRSTSNQIWCWGENGHGEVGDGTKVSRPNPFHVLDATSIAAGRNHTCATNSDGTVSCWGAGYQGRLGNGLGNRTDGNSLDQPIPAQVLTELGGTAFSGVASVAAGASTCALMQNKDLYCWGVDLYGQTGTGAGTYVPLPVLKADGTPLRNVARVIAQYTRTCAFTTNGALYCWGRNSEGQLGNGTFKNIGVATPMMLSCP